MALALMDWWFCRRWPRSEVISGSIMAAITNLPPCPDNLKPMLHYIKAAIEHDNRDPVVAYWLRFHAVQLGIRIDGKSKPAKQFISGVMDTLETTKKTLKGNEAVTNDVVAQAHIENYALKLFNWADAEDRAGHFNKNVIKAFYSAGMLFDVLAVWGISEINEELAKQQKYAKWKAAYIHNCLKNGDTPIAGPQDMPGGGPDDEMFDASSGHNNNPVSGGKVWLLGDGFLADVFSSAVLVQSVDAENHSLVCDISKPF